MLFIIGCGRSGTTYTTQLLNELGLDVGHEELKKDGEVGWKSFIKLLKQEELSPAVVLHQVRHPIPTISSLRTHTKALLNEVSQYFPVKSTLKTEDSKLHRCMEYWYHWNLLCESKASWTFQIEELKNNFEVFCDKARIPLNYEVMKNLRTDINTRRIKRFEKFQVEPVNWDKLFSLDHSLTDEIQQLAQRYGYQI